MSEEQQIQEFVHRAVSDKELRDELVLSPANVLGRGNYSPRVLAILLRLVPCLMFERPLYASEKWWHA